jgi:carbon monoxide dehydrogenase subunit G
MRTWRRHIRIARSPEEVWKVVSDAGAVAAWAPNVEQSSVSGNRRHVEFTEGLILEEEIVTSDDDLRRFQYEVIEVRVKGPDGVVEVPNLVENLSTVDVIEDGDGALVIYSNQFTSVDPDAEQAAVEFVKVSPFLQGLKEYLER